MKKSKILSLFKILFLLLVILRIIFSFTFDKQREIPNYNVFRGEILSIKIDDDKITIKLNSKEKIIVNYYLKENEDYSYLKVGDIIEVEGNLDYPSENSNFNLFNYKNYLYHKKIYKIINIK